ncbi:hypothetical protein [Bradyrhizobium sp. C9]|uniref:hypothetical protein n=1 Tax=Bradyrhizobium sp. C9 TaxID=142585 RepID=UPI0018EA1109|nr:hypothetical protein [Bradyrhizobium sp. C9]
MTKERQAEDAADAFRLLRAFRAIRDRAARRRIVETVEAIANDRAPAGDAPSFAINQK